MVDQGAPQWRDAQTHNGGDAEEQGGEGHGESPDVVEVDHEDREGHAVAEAVDDRGGVDPTKRASNF